MASFGMSGESRVVVSNPDSEFGASIVVFKPPVILDCEAINSRDEGVKVSEIFGGGSGVYQFTSEDLAKGNIVPGQAAILFLDIADRAINTPEIDFVEIK